MSAPGTRALGRPVRGRGVSDTEASRIKHAVLVLKWSHSKTAKEFGFTHTTVGRIVRGEGRFAGLEPMPFDPKNPRAGLPPRHGQAGEPQVTIPCTPSSSKKRSNRA